MGFFREIPGIQEFMPLCFQLFPSWNNLTKLTLCLRYGYWLHQMNRYIHIKQWIYHTCFALALYIYIYCSSTVSVEGAAWLNSLSPCHIYLHWQIMASLGQTMFCCLFTVNSIIELLVTIFNAIEMQDKFEIVVCKMAPAYIFLDANVLAEIQLYSLKFAENCANIIT